MKNPGIPRAVFLSMLESACPLSTDEEGRFSQPATSIMTHYALIGKHLPATTQV